MLRRLINWWKNSKIFKTIYDIENRHFRKKLNNTDFTLLTPNCMGGLIYHRLGKRFDSPTIDLSIDTDDFCSFLDNFEYYLSKDITEYTKNNESTDAPIGVIKGNSNEIPDIRIKFVHYKTFEQARDKWNLRKTRINSDNLYVIMCDIDNINEENCDKAGYISEENLKKFESFKCNNKALLTRNPNNTKEYAYYIKPQYNKKYPLVYMNRDVFGLNRFEKKFDFVSFLNKK